MDIYITLGRDDGVAVDDALLVAATTTAPTARMECICLGAGNDDDEEALAGTASVATTFLPEPSCIIMQQRMCNS